MSELAIIIVSYNARSYLEACLSSLHSAQPRYSHDIVIVDNGSVDGSVEMVRSNWPSVQVIEMGANLGYSKANNRGISSTESELILLLNSDTVVPPGSIDGLIRELQLHNDVAVVGPRLVDGNGNPELSFGSMINPWTELRQKLKLSLLRKRVPLLSGWVAGNASRRHYPDWVSGACLLMRRVDAYAVALLDERFFLYAEDVDLCARIRLLNRRILFAPNIEVVHHGGRSGLNNKPNTHRAYRQSQLAFYRKYHPGWERLLRLYLRIKRDLPRGV